MLFPACFVALFVIALLNKKNMKQFVRFISVEKSVPISGLSYHLIWTSSIYTIDTNTHFIHFRLRGHAKYIYMFDVKTG